MNPDVEFDWTRILKGDVEARPEADRRSHQRRPEGSRRGGPPPSSTFSPQRRSTDQRSAEQPITVVEPPAAAEVATDESDGFMPAVELTAEIVGIAEDEVPPPTAAHARLGSEGVLRLRGRYAELLARLRERVQDAARLEELKGHAERLNPDTWVTDAEVTAGLEQYEEVFESLRAVVGGRRRRRRRGPRADAAE